MNVIYGKSFQVWGGNRHEIMIFGQHGRRERDGRWFSNADARDLLVSQPLGPPDTMSPLSIAPPLPFISNAFAQTALMHPGVAIAGLRVSSRMAMYMYLADLLRFGDFEQPIEDDGMFIVLRRVLVDGREMKLCIFPSDEPYIGTLNSDGLILWTNIA